MDSVGPADLAASMDYVASVIPSITTLSLSGPMAAQLRLSSPTTLTFVGSTLFASLKKVGPSRFFLLLNVLDSKSRDVKFSLYSAKTPCGGPDYVKQSKEL